MPATAPASVDAQLAVAQALFQRDDVTRAEALLRSAQAREPAHEDVATLLAKVLQSRGRLGAAANVLLAACRASGFEPAMSLRCARFAQQCDRHAVAAQICEGALAVGSSDPQLLALAGNVARETGDFETARARYLAALEAGIDLDRHHVLGALANTRRYVDPADAEIARFEHHFADPRYSPRSRASAGFALAKARNDLADYRAAAQTLREANAMVHAAWPWDRTAWQSFVAARVQERIAAGAAVADCSFVPVFIVGLPRTGTTLTATLLARASGARDRGELRALRYIAEQLIRGGHLASPAAVAEGANLYRMLAVQDDEPATWYLDQDPLNFRWLHIAAAMFPQARVIHLRRDRRDTALSLWSQDFAHPDLAFAYAFDDMRAYMAGHDALMDHWKQSLSLQIFELDYETLVTQTEPTLARLREFIGAPDTTPDVAQDAAPVQSSSVWQARQPVYASSVGRWRNYVPYVPELKRIG
ncbi:MAG TPA: sulfotransferase [Rhodanobacteraceae bacterium]|nr:sulfotransferase [Rhodanobacteraceae bacterium]